MAGDIKAIMTLDDKDVQRGWDRVRRKAGETAQASEREFKKSNTASGMSFAKLATVATAAAGGIAAARRMATKGIEEYSKVNSTFALEQQRVAQASERLWQSVGRNISYMLPDAEAFLEALTSGYETFTNIVASMSGKSAEEIAAIDAERRAQEAADIQRLERVAERTRELRAEMAAASDRGDDGEVARLQAEIERLGLQRAGSATQARLNEQRRLDIQSEYESRLASIEARKQKEIEKQQEAVDLEAEQARIQAMRLQGMEEAADMAQVALENRQRIAELDRLEALGVNVSAARAAQAALFAAQQQGKASPAAAAAAAAAAYRTGTRVLSTAAGGNNLARQVFGGQFVNTTQYAKRTADATQKTVDLLSQLVRNTGGPARFA